MKIFIKNHNTNYQEIISFENLDNIYEAFKNFSLMKGSLEVKIFVINESINSNELSKLKINLYKINVSSLCIYSNNRETILTGK